MTSPSVMTAADIDATAAAASFLNFRRDLAKGKASIACVGDSTTRQAFSDTTLPGKVAQGWPAKLTAKMIAAGIPAENDSFFGMSSYADVATLASTDSRLSIGSGWVQGPYASLGGLCLLNSSTTNAITFTPSNIVDTVDVYYITGSIVGTASVSVDGGAPISTINGYATGGRGIAKASISFPRGTHAISIARQTASFFVIGVHAYDTTSPRVAIYNMGWNGSTAAAWAANSTTPDGTLAMMALISPSLAIVNITVNDADQNTDLSLYAANMQAILTKIQATPTDCLVANGLPIDPSRSAGVADRVQAVRTATRTLAQSNSVPFFDIQYTWPSWTQMNALGFLKDWVHPLSYGMTILQPDIYGILWAPVRFKLLSFHSS
jgi:lysophospholipase L1-like esterase